MAMLRGWEERSVVMEGVDEGGAERDGMDRVEDKKQKEHQLNALRQLQFMTWTNHESVKELQPPGLAAAMNSKLLHL